MTSRRYQFKQQDTLTLKGTFHFRTVSDLVEQWSMNPKVRGLISDSSWLNVTVSLDKTL